METALGFKAPNIWVMWLNLFELQFPVGKTEIRRPTSNDAQKTGGKHAVSDSHCFCSLSTSVLETKSHLSPADKYGPERTSVQRKWESKKH